MIIGKVAEWMSKLEKGEAVIIGRDDIYSSAEAYKDSGFDHVRPEYAQKVVDEANSQEYPGYSLWERPDGRWTLEMA